MLNLLSVAIGVLFVVLALAATGVGGALSRRVARPPTTVERVGFLIVGLLAIARGLYLLLK